MLQMSYMTSVVAIGYIHQNYRIISRDIENLIVIFYGNGLNDINNYDIIKGKWMNTKVGIKCNKGQSSSVMWIGDKEPNSLFWYKYKFQVNIKLYNYARFDYGDAGILFNSQTILNNNNNGNQMYFGISKNNRIIYGKMDSCWIEYIRNKNIKINASKFNKLTVFVDGNKAKLYVNDILFFVDNSIAYKYGSIGLRTFKIDAIYQNISYLDLSKKSV